jgi:hypothetical protein
MKEQIFKDGVLEAVFRQAVIDNFERELEEIEKEPDVETSERHGRRMSALFAARQRRQRASDVFVWAKKLATAAAVLFILLSGTLLTTPEVRASVSAVIAGWFDAFIQFGQGDSDESGIADWHPASLPEGFPEVEKVQAGEVTAIYYANDDGVIIEFTYVTNDNTLSTSNEGVEYGQSPRGGIVYHTFTAVSGDYKSAVVWDADGYLFSVAGYLPIERLLETAWSVERG